MDTGLVWKSPVMYPSTAAAAAAECQRTDDASICVSQEGQLEAPPPLPPFYDAVAADEEAVLRSLGVIHHSVTAIADAVATLLRYWEAKYKHLWEQDKDAYMRCRCQLLRQRLRS